MNLSLEQLRAYAIKRSLFAPESLLDAIVRLGYVQADPIRAPARAQDLILRHRVRGYQTGDLEKAYPTLPVEEDWFVNYGFLPRTAQRFLHPRNQSDALAIDEHAPGLSQKVLAFVQQNGAVHPKEVQKALGRLSVQNYWGGLSSATTRALDTLQYQGLLRIARRDAGIRVYETAAHLAPVIAAPLAADKQASGLVQLIVDLYAPLPETSLNRLVSMLRYAAPRVDRRADVVASLLRRRKLRRVRVDGVDYIVPAQEAGGISTHDAPARVRLLAPFDPVVWDRRRFLHFWGWDYRFEAYTPPAKRKLGYYALPLLWRDQVIGWANVKIANGRLQTELGYVEQPPRSKVFQRALEAELARMERFLRLDRETKALENL